MGDRSSIEWCDATWNPVVGCTRVSEGCRNCYAEREAIRHQRLPAYEGTARSTPAGPRWTGRVNFLPERLEQPLRWTRGRRVFVNSMSDLFHEGLTDEQIAAVFGVMAATPQHTYQVLTKRPERAVERFRWVAKMDSDDPSIWCLACADGFGDDAGFLVPDGIRPAWPLPNVWLGVSAEDQATANERIPLLLRCPAAARWVSAEPLLGPIDFRDRERREDVLGYSWTPAGRSWLHRIHRSAQIGWEPALDWVVVGGESGPKARPCDVAWIRAILEQCRDAGVPAFCKQLGARPIQTCHLCLGTAADDWMCGFCHGMATEAVLLRDRKGGDPSEWPEDLRIREWPAGVAP